MSRPILIVDDDPRVRAIICRMLENAGHQTRAVPSAEDALDVLQKESFPLIITDVSMPGMSGLEFLERLQAMESPPPAIVASGEGTIDRAVRAVQLGALDFLTKPLEKERLVLTVQNALRFSRLASAHAHLKAEMAASSQLVGRSPGMERLRALIAKVAPSDGRVLILGENGTGKELVAAAIHQGSERSEASFVKLNCAAVPENLVESELFGHEKGAFTGAVKSRIGRFELADGGTLFLDEIGDMPAPMQAKLLRVLQEGTFERVGGDHTIRVDVRVIAATNRDMDLLVEEGTFREDLLYRLNVVTLEIPPLRERAEDIEELAQHFLRESPRRGGRQLRLSDAAMQLLCRQPFPGNVRELSNIIERLAILASGELVDEAELELLLPRRRVRRSEAAPPRGGYRSGTPLRELLLESEREILLAAIDDFGGKKVEAATALGVERSHFYKKCRKLGIE